MYEFIAKKVNFEGNPGYFVSQLHNGKVVVEQFISEECYAEFCKAIGIVPELLED